MNEEELKALKDRQEWLLKATSLLYDKSASYTNLIMVAGYAAYFAMWSNTVSLISACLARVSAALMLISLITFIFWEVTKMILIALNNKNLAQVSLAPLSEFQSMLQAQQLKENRLMARLAKAWPTVLFIAIPTAFIAIFIHICALVGANILR
ncbi:MAG TPA: hypothetical protein VIE69_05310 [Methylophilaceae bacterium]|jgi:hypothetical protein